MKAENMLKNSGRKLEHGLEKQLKNTKDASQEEIEKLNHKFCASHEFVPNVSKMGKSSLFGDALSYI